MNNSAFYPPSMFQQGGVSGAVAMQQKQGPPASPSRSGGDFVGGTVQNSDLGGMPGVRTKEREDTTPRTASRPKGVNFASPDPNLSQSAFTMSQNAASTMQAALQAHAARQNSINPHGPGGVFTRGPNTPSNLNLVGNGNNNNNNNFADDTTFGGTGNETTQMADTMTEQERRIAADPALQNLKRYKDGGGGGGMFNPGRNMNRGFTQHPSMSGSCRLNTTPTFNNNNNNSNISPTSLLNSNNNMNNRPQQQQQQQQQTTNGQQTNTQPNNQSQLIGYHLSDPGAHFKTFTETSSWVAIMQFIIPPATRKAKKIHICSMMAPASSDDVSATVAGVGGGGTESTYSLRLVDPSGGPIDANGNQRSLTLWADYNASNTDDFQIFTADLEANNAPAPKKGIIELQAYNTAGLPILISAAVMEM